MARVLDALIAVKGAKRARCPAEHAGSGPAEERHGPHRDDDAAISTIDVANEPSTTVTRKRRAHHRRWLRWNAAVMVTPRGRGRRTHRPTPRPRPYEVG